MDVNDEDGTYVVFIRPKLCAEWLPVTPLLGQTSHRWISIMIHKWNVEGYYEWLDTFIEFLQNRMVR